MSTSFQNRFRLASAPGGEDVHTSMHYGVVTDVRFVAVAAGPDSGTVAYVLARHNAVRLTGKVLREVFWRRGRNARATWRYMDEVTVSSGLSRVIPSQSGSTTANTELCPGIFRARLISTRLRLRLGPDPSASQTIVAM